MSYRKVLLCLALATSFSGSASAYADHSGRQNGAADAKVGLDDSSDKEFLHYLGGRSYFKGYDQLTWHVLSQIPAYDIRARNEYIHTTHKKYLRKALEEFKFSRMSPSW